MTCRPLCSDIRDWQQDAPTAEVYAWVLSQPPEIVIEHLRERPELWRAVCKQIEAATVEACAVLVETHGQRPEYNYWWTHRLIIELVAAIRAR